MDAYTLKKKNDTGELHLFKGKMTEKSCTSEKTSICKMMDKAESEKNIFTCKDEDTAREKCAEIGRDVCGVCVSNLYASYK
jgi:hypothetical protein